MLFRLTITSDEAEEFLRDMTIDADATFLDLCKAILDTCGYADDQITSFYVTDENWRKKSEITREDMGMTPYEEDIYTMADTQIRSLVDDVPAHLKFIFDTFNHRALFLEMKEIVPGKHLDKAVVKRSIAQAPPQILAEEKPAGQKGKHTADENFIGEDFYGSEGFNEDDIEGEGLDISEGLPEQ